MSDPTPQDLHQVLDYHPDTGEFTWKKNIPAKGGHLAGSRNHKMGYVRIRILGKQRRADLIAWAMTHGVWLSDGIEHINGDTGDNRLANLRPVDYKTMLENPTDLRDSVSGLLGVVRAGTKWRAVVLEGSTYRHLGKYDSPEAAHAAYLEAKSNPATPKPRVICEVREKARELGRQRDACISAWRDSNQAPATVAMNTKAAQSKAKIKLTQKSDGRWEVKVIVGNTARGQKFDTLEQARTAYDKLQNNLHKLDTRSKA